MNSFVVYNKESVDSMAFSMMKALEIMDFLIEKDAIKDEYIDFFNEKLEFMAKNMKNYEEINRYLKDIGLKK